MKYLLLVLCIFAYLFCFSQKKFILTSDSISVKYIMSEDSLRITERVEISNLSQHNIFIPDIRNRDIYFFILNNTLYSHFGIMTSKLGMPNLSLDVKLIKIAPEEIYSLDLSIPKGEIVVVNSVFSFDYIRLRSSKKKQNKVTTISMEEYSSLHRYAIGQIIE